MLHLKSVNLIPQKIKMHRRTFVKHTGLVAAVGSLSPDKILETSSKNKLPKWKGFNLLDFFSPDPAKAEEEFTKEEYLKWMRDWGFDFVRIPIAYPYYLDIDRAKNITAADVYKIDQKAVDR